MYGNSSIEKGIRPELSSNSTALRFLSVNVAFGEEGFKVGCYGYSGGKDRRTRMVMFTALPVQIATVGWRLSFERHPSEVL